MIKSIIKTIIIYINHAVNIFITKQTTFNIFSTNKFNLRLIQAFQYLFTFNISLRHKMNKKNVILNALSQLKSFILNIKNKIGVLNVLYDTHVFLNEHEYSNSLSNTIFV